jgi:hypothetical protein
VSNYTGDINKKLDDISKDIREEVALAWNYFSLSLTFPVSLSSLRKAGLYLSGVPWSTILVSYRSYQWVSG